MKNNQTDLKDARASALYSILKKSVFGQSISDIITQKVAFAPSAALGYLFLFYDKHLSTQYFHIITIAIVLDRLEYPVRLVYSCDIMQHS